MGKLLVLYLLIPVYLKFRYRKSPRIKRNIERWFLLFTAVLLLLIAPWGAVDGAFQSTVLRARVAAAFGFLVYLLYDIRQQVRAAGPG